MLNGLIVNGRGTKCYYVNNKLHREDGPAIEWVNGEKQWIINGHLLHREDGPAILMPDGREYFFLNNIEYSKEDYWQEIKKRKSLNNILSKFCRNIKERFI